MQNIVGVFVVLSLISYSLTRFLIWLAGAVFKKEAPRRFLLWSLAVQFAGMIFLIAWGHTQGTLDKVAITTIAAIVATFISYSAIRYEAELKSGPFGVLPEAEGPVGNSGLLYFFTFMISAYAPLSQAGQISSIIRQSEEDLRYLRGNGDWNELVSITWVIVALYIVGYSYAGVLLRSEFRRETVAKVVAIMWAGGPGLSWLMARVNQYYYDRIDPDFVGSADPNLQLATSVILAAIWTAYLSKSKRVLNTYPER